MKLVSFPKFHFIRSPFDTFIALFILFGGHFVIINKWNTKYNIFTSFSAVKQQVTFLPSPRMISLSSLSKFLHFLHGNSTQTLILPRSTFFFLHHHLKTCYGVISGLNIAAFSLLSAAEFSST